MAAAVGTFLCNGIAACSVSIAVDIFVYVGSAAGGASTAGATSGIGITRADRSFFVAIIKGTDTCMGTVAI